MSPLTSEQALESLHAYFAPLSELHFTRGGVRLCITPDCPVLGINTAYGYSPEADATFVGRYAPPLFLVHQGQELELFQRGSSGNCVLEAVLEVGSYTPSVPAAPAVYQVEQTPWTRAGTAAALLAQAWLDAGWTLALTRWLSRVLERAPGHLLLLAYPLEGEVPVGMALVQCPTAGAGSVYRLHLWGVLPDHPLALEALLESAAGLGGPLEVSGPQGTLALGSRTTLAYWRAA